MRGQSHGSRTETEQIKSIKVSFIKSSALHISLMALQIEHVD